MKKPTKASTFRMSALVAGLAAAGTTGYLANRPPPLSDKQIIDGLLRRVEDERFRAQVNQIGRARGLIGDAETMPAQAPPGNGPSWWRPLPDDADTCPETGVMGIRVLDDYPPGTPPWDQSWQWVHPTDPSIRWAHWTGTPTNADPTANGIWYVHQGSTEPLAWAYREVFLTGNWAALTPTQRDHMQRPLTAADFAALGMTP